MALPVPFEAVATPVPSRLGSFATAVQTRIDAITLAVQPPGEMLITVCVSTCCASIQAVVDTVTAMLELAFAMFADAIETLVDVLAEICGCGCARTQ